MPGKRPSSWSERIFLRRKQWSHVAALAGGAALLVIIIVVAAVLLLQKPDGTSLKTVTVKRSAYHEILRQNGKVDAHTIRSVFNKVTGTITWLIAEGTSVKEGDEIVHIDDGEISRNLEDFIEQTCKPAQFALESAMQTLKTKRLELDISVKLAEINLKLAQLARRELDERYRDDLEIARLNAKISRVEADIAQLSVDVNAPLVERGIVAENTLSTLIVDALNTKAAYEEVAERIRRLEQGPTPLEKRAADNAIKVVEENLNTAVFTRDADIATHESNVAHSKAQLDKHEIEKRRKEERLKRCVVRAPLPGVVVYVNVWKGGGDLSPIHVGETRRRGMDLLKMADTSSLEVNILLGEPDALKLHLGQKAMVHFVAFPDLVLPARVTYISPDAFDKNQKLGSLALAKLGEAGVKVLEVRLTLEGDDPRIRLGLTAVAEIETSRLEDALVIPVNAVVEDGEGTYCWRSSGGGFERTTITLEHWDAVQAVVSNGLKEGDVILDAPLIHGYH